MNPFDDDLRQTLRRRDPSAAFTSRVLAELRRREAVTEPAPAPWWRWMAAAAAVGVLGVAPLAYVQHLRAVEGERAKEQVLTAFYVAGTSLRDVQALVSRRP